MFIHSGLCVCFTELGSQSLISVGEENIRDSLFRKKGKAVHLSHTVNVKSSSARPPSLPHTHIYTHT